jgi:hypothetical protein
MTIDAPIRTRLIDKIQQMPENKLQVIDRFLEELQDTIGKKEVIISFAGGWKDMDNSILDEFTEGLITRRERNRERGLWLEH